MKDEPYETYAFVARFGANIVELSAWPRENIGAVGKALSALELDWQPALLDEGGHARALLHWSPDDYSDETIGEIADGLVGAGIGAYGFVPFCDHEFGDAHVFRRVGSRWPRRPSGVVFIRSYVLEEGVDMWIFGAPADLLLAEDCVRRGGDPEPVDGPEGYQALEVRLRDPLEREELVAQQHELLIRLLEDHAGLTVHRSVSSTPREPRARAQDDAGDPE